MPVGVLGRETARAAADRLGCPVLAWEDPLPPRDLTIVAVRDDAIAGVAASITPPSGGLVFHLSGLTTVGVLQPLASAGAEVGAFHPLQPCPTSDRGAAALAGCHVAISAVLGDAFAGLATFAQSLGATPFRLADVQKPLYHAAAATSSNYLVTVLALAFELFSAAGSRSRWSPVPWSIRWCTTSSTADRGGAHRAHRPRRRRYRISATCGGSRVSVELEKAFVTARTMTAELAGTSSPMATPLGGGVEMEIVETFRKHVASTWHQSVWCPTLGFVHEGHLSLIGRARRSVITCSFRSSSILCNSDPARTSPPIRAIWTGTPDSSKLPAPTSCLLRPLEEMYPVPAVTRVLVPELAERMEGASRPGHFDGVSTVVAKLLAGAPARPRLLRQKGRPAIGHHRQNGVRPVDTHHRRRLSDRSGGGWGGPVEQQHLPCAR